MSLDKAQVKKISTAYELTWAVLDEMEHKEDPKKQEMFELSAAVGVLRTLLMRNQKEQHAHQST